MEESNELIGRYVAEGGREVNKDKETSWKIDDER